MRVKIVFLGIAGAALLSLCAGCGAEGNDSCGPSTCSGCCTATGVCIQATTSVSTVQTCGLAGGACALCQSTERCNNGVCTGDCGPINCPSGCCNGATCVTSPSTAACGTAGAACVPCGSTEQCLQGACTKQPCGPTSCPAGCCCNDACLPGTNPGVCGSGGSACVSCKNGEKCESQQCKAVACGPTTCSGCCDSNGNCAPGNSEANCGVTGQACKTCQDKEVCKAGSCQGSTGTCDATSCSTGCCDSQGQCLPGNTGAACGVAGGACASCSSTQACVAGKCACTATSCVGCCEADKCRPGHLAATCGVGGATCKVCSGGTSCSAGNCQAGCSAATCLAGCCDGTTCKTGTTDAACGTAGQTCKSCGIWETCTGGVCNDSFLCSSSTCPSGCCKDSQCMPGTDALSCGGSGQVCKVCPPYAFCDTSKTCKLKPASKWKVSVELVKVDNQKSYDPWPANVAPDIYVELKVGSVIKKTQTIDNKYDPVFNEYVFTATAQELLGAIQISIWDYDPYDPDDPIASCSNTFFESELKAGTATIYYCGSSSDLKQITFNFAPDLTP